MASLVKLRGVDLSDNHLTGTALSSLFLPALQYQSKAQESDGKSLKSDGRHCCVLQCISVLFEQDCICCCEVKKGLEQFQLPKTSAENYMPAGGIPVDFGNLTSLEALTLDENPLGGTIPSSFHSLQSLVVLSLANCGLTGNSSKSGDGSKSWPPYVSLPVAISSLT